MQLRRFLANQWLHTPKDRTRSVNPSFVHVWMPPLVQVVFERLEHVIGCGHVSGLSLRRLIQPRAGMAMRGSEADQQTELIGSSTNTAFSDPDIVDPLPLLFIELLTLPTRRDRMESAVYLCHPRHQ